MSKLFGNFKKFRNKTALISHNNKKYTYNYIEKKTTRLSSKINKGSIILIISSNSVECILGYISFIRSNNVSILLDENFKIRYIEKIIKKYKPNYIFTPKKFLSKFKETNKVVSGKEFFLLKTNYKKYNKINKKNLLLLSTSGTTQNPKFVRLSHLNLINNTNSIIDYLNINSNHTTITTLPMAYSYGLSILNTHLQSGASIIVNNKTIFDRSFWKIFKKYKITSFGGVAQFYEQLKKLEFERMNFPSLKYITQAGGKMENDTLKYFGKTCRRKKIKMIIMYGQTEASPRMSYLEWKNFFSKFGSIGKALKGSSFHIIDNKGKNINKPNTTGELIFYGKNVCLGYANNINDLSKGDLNKRKLFTGDLVRKDNSGHYYIVGRKNRISKIFGLRVNLDDIENYLKEKHFKVKCIPDNKNLKILSKNDYSFEKIKSIIFNYYGINKKYILISKVKKITNTGFFK